MVLSIPDANSSWWFRPQPTSFKLIGHNLTFRLQLPGQPLKLQLLRQSKEDKT